MREARGRARLESESRGDEQGEEDMRLLAHFIRHAPRSATIYVDAIHQALLRRLDQSATTQTPATLAATGELLQIDSLQQMALQRRVTPILVELVQELKLTI